MVKMFFQTIIIIPKGVLEGFYNGWIDNYYKNVSLSIGGWIIVFLKSALKIENRFTSFYMQNVLQKGFRIFLIIFPKTRPFNLNFGFKTFQY